MRFSVAKAAGFATQTLQQMKSLFLTSTYHHRIRIAEIELQNLRMALGGEDIKYHPSSSFNPPSWTGLPRNRLGFSGPIQPGFE